MSKAATKSAVRSARAEILGTLAGNARFGVLAENVRYVGDLTRRAVGATVATALLVTSGALLQHRIEQQDQANARLASEQASTAQQLTEMQARLKRIGGIVNDLGDTNVPKGVLSGESLARVETLPGYGRTVSPELAAKVKAATVKIGMSGKTTSASPAPDWWPNCTATKVTYQGRDFVFAAAHCFEGGLDDPNKDAPVKGGPGDVARKPNAVNITEQSRNMYAILDPEIPADQRGSSEPLAFVTNIAIDRSGETDWALMEVTPNPNAPRSWSAIEGVEMGSATTQQRAHTSGQDAIAYSMPGSSGNTLITQTGTYLGRVFAPAGFTSSYSYDVVAIKPGNNTQDTCDYGASGSQAMLADGTTTGPLSYRNSIGYPDDSREPNDYTASSNRQTRLAVERQTGVNLDGFPTLCFYSTSMDDITALNLTSVLDNPAVQTYPPESMKMK